MYDNWQNNREQYRCIHEDGADPTSVIDRELAAARFREAPDTDKTARHYHALGFDIRRQQIARQDACGDWQIADYVERIELAACPNAACSQGRVWWRDEATECRTCQGRGELTPKRYSQVHRGDE